MGLSFWLTPEANRTHTPAQHDSKTCISSTLCVLSSHLLGGCGGPRRGPKAQEDGGVIGKAPGFLNDFMKQDIPPLDIPDYE